MSKTSEGYEIDKPLNQWVEETVDVKRIVPKDDGEKISFEEVTEKAKQKTMYIDVKPTKLACSFENHKFSPTGKHPEFQCEECGFITMAHPVTFKYDPKTKRLEYRI